MYDQIAKYSQKLCADGSAQPGCIAIAAQDDTLVADGNRALAQLARAILSRLNSLAVVAAEPSLPFADFLIRRSEQHQREIVPRDTETRTFLHDIPIIRRNEITEEYAVTCAHFLGNRKGIIVEGIGIIAVGALTVEQAYINWSSVFHSTYIKYLEDLLESGFMLPDEEMIFQQFRTTVLEPLTACGLKFRSGPLVTKTDILDELSRVGRYTVQQHLVDSFFGNISYSDGTIIHISQTASSLDELSGCIDPVPFENSSTVGITASSELVAHRAIFEATGCRAILHGHPRFAVVMSMICEEKEACRVDNCWRDCVMVRELDGTPIVAGEIGAGGLARSVPPVIGRTGSAIVYGHGVFSIGMTGFQQAFQGLLDVENYCRQEYFRRFDERWPSP